MPAQLLQPLTIPRRHHHRRVQREAVALRTQRRLHPRERLAAAIPAHPRIPLTSSFPKRRATLHRRRGSEGWSEPSEFFDVVEGEETKVEWQLRAAPGKPR